MISVNIKSSSGINLSIQVDENSTIGEFKQLLEPQCNIPASQQRLIYAGHVLKDNQTISSYCKTKKLFPQNICLIFLFKK